jgi:uncharacterized membrane protein HdeD (DUF308 family)
MFGIFLILVGLVFIARQVLAWRDSVSHPNFIRYVAIKSGPFGVPLVVAGLLLFFGHGIGWLLLAFFFFASAICAGVLQIMRSTKMLPRTPPLTVVVGSFDFCALTLAFNAHSNPLVTVMMYVAEFVLFIGSLAWMIGGAFDFFRRPMLARRREEADAAMRRLQDASQGEG